MKRKLLLYFTILPLLAAGLAGCSSDEDEDEDFDGLVYEQVDGGKIYVFERSDYPDSIKWVGGRIIPCKRIPREQLPAWVVDVLYGELGYILPSSAYQGEWIDSGESVYMFYNLLYVNPVFIKIYSSDGNWLDIYGDMKTWEKNPTWESEAKFMNATHNWRCIHRVTNYYEK